VDRGIDALLLVLRQWLRILPDAAHTAVSSRLANHLLRGQAQADRLEPLEGKRLCLAVLDTGSEWRFRVSGNRLYPDPESGPWDARISGNLTDLLLLATRSEDPDTLFFARRLNLEGDTETALYVKNFLDALELDRDAHLQSVIGPQRAAMVVAALERCALAGRLHEAAMAFRRRLARRISESAGRGPQTSTASNDTAANAHGT
jgi:predicted lipid carrier protein YhbT